jgi:hypothetical protein
MGSVAWRVGPALASQVASLVELTPMPDVVVLLPLEIGAHREMKVSRRLLSELAEKERPVLWAAYIARLGTTTRRGLVKRLRITQAVVCTSHYHAEEGSKMPSGTGAAQRSYPQLHNGCAGSILPPMGSVTGTDIGMT